MTDLYRAGVLRIVQQPHCAVAFPVQTPDAAAHQSAQHLLGGLRTGPQRRAYIQVWICCHVNDAPASALRSNTWSAAASVRSGGGGGASFVSSACKRREGGGGWCVSSLGARVFFFFGEQCYCLRCCSLSGPAGLSPLTTPSPSSRLLAVAMPL